MQAIMLENSKEKHKFINDFGLCLIDRIQIPTPFKNVENIEVKGRDGTLTIEHDYADIDISVTLNGFNDNFKQMFRNLKTFLIDVKKIYITDDNNFFYKVKYIKIENLENEIKEFGKFTIVFRCEPFLYSKKGDMWVDLENLTMWNNEGYITYPIFLINSNSKVRFTLNDTHSFELEALNQDIIVDCLNMSVYSKDDKVNRLKNMKGDFFKLEMGMNKITHNISKGGSNKVMIKYNERWI